LWTGHWRLRNGNADKTREQDNSRRGSAHGAISFHLHQTQAVWRTAIALRILSGTIPSGIDLLSTILSTILHEARVHGLSGHCAVAAIEAKHAFVAAELELRSDMRQAFAAFR